MAEATPEMLLADAAWLKRLAVTLAGNADDADDLVQESWIAAWRKKPAADRPLRPWLAKVIRDLAKMRRRGAARRVAREDRAADEREPQAPDALLEQMRLQRLLVDLVLELEEPYRATVIATFVEGRRSAEIARVLAIPESTVRGRLRDALARLRSRMDERLGGRGRWAPAVLAFARRGARLIPPAKAVAVLALALMLCLGGWMLLASRGSNDREDRSQRWSSPAGVGSVVGRSDAVPATERLARLAAGSPPGWLSQQGVPPRRIAGRVLVDGVAARGALVRLTSDVSRAGLAPVLERRTGADGRFDFGPQLARAYEMGAAIDGRVPAIEPVDVRDPRIAVDDLVLTLDSCVVGLYGKVVDGTGTPIAHAQLLARDVIGAETHADGSFDLCLRADGVPEDLRLVVRASGYGAVQLIANLEGRVRHDFVLSPDGSVAGRVVAANGEGLSDVEVRLESDDPAPRSGSEDPAPGLAITDTGGHFEIAGLATGRWRVAGLGRGLVSTPMTVQLGVGESKQVVLAMSAGTTVHGHVELDGRPVAGVTVSAGGAASAVSQQDGSFALDDVSLGDVRIATSPYRWKSHAPIRISGGDQDLVLELEASGSLDGTVRRHGTPVAHAIVTATSWSSYAATTDAAGRFHLEGLPAAEYRVAAIDSTVGARGGTDVVLGPGEDKELELELDAGARISGRVDDERGVPVAGAYVRVLAPDGLAAAECASDREGRFACTKLHAGTYEVSVGAEKGGLPLYELVSSQPASLVISDGDTRIEGVNLVVSVRRQTIRGVVVDATGAGVAGARVAAVAGWDVTSLAPSVVTDAGGRFELRDLASGVYAVLVQGPDGSNVTTPAVMTGGDPIRIELQAASCDAEHEPIPVRPRGRVVWNDSIELVGWDVPATAAVGRPAELTLYYRVLRPIDRAWRVFVHVDGSHMRVRGDHDPLGGRCPTSAWRPGDIIADRFTTTAFYDPGPYTVWIGFYVGMAPSWTNMPITDAPAATRDEHGRVQIANLVAQ